MKHAKHANLSAVIVSAIAIVVVTCAGRTYVAEPASGQTVSWSLSVGPQEGSQSIVCASDKPDPCGIHMTNDNEKPVEAMAVVALPPTGGHKFKGKAVLGFIGTEGYTMTIDHGTEKDPIRTGTIGVIKRTGDFPLRIALEETGADLQNPLHHNIEVTVTVQ